MYPCRPPRTRSWWHGSHPDTWGEWCEGLALPHPPPCCSWSCHWTYSYSIWNRWKNISLLMVKIMPWWLACVRTQGHQSMSTLATFPSAFPNSDILGEQRSQNKQHCWSGGVWKVVDFVLSWKTFVHVGKCHPMFFWVEAKVQNVYKELQATGEAPDVLWIQGGHTEGVWTLDQGGKTEFAFVPMYWALWRNGRWKTTVIHTVIIHSVTNQESRNMVDRDLGLLLGSPLGLFV